MNLINEIRNLVNRVAGDVKSVDNKKLDKTAVIPLTNGGTGATTAETARDNLGFGTTLTDIIDLKNNKVDKASVAVNVKDFGAKGDGIADDTAAIQAALDSATVGKLTFPTGTYKITAPLKLINKSTSFNRGSYIIDGCGSRIVGNDIVIDSSKRIVIDNLDIANQDIILQGCWYSEFNNVKFSSLLTGKSAGTSFSSNYWNTFNSCLFQNIVTAAAAADASNEFTFNSCFLRGDATQGFTSTKANAIELNADKNIQSWKFYGGDISYHQSVVNINQLNTKDVEILFSGVYFDSALPTPTSRDNTLIEVQNCHFANGDGLTATASALAKARIDLFRTDRSFKYDTLSDKNLVPNGDLKERLSTWYGDNAPLSGLSGSTVTAKDGGINGTYLNINQQNTTSQSSQKIQFTCRDAPFASIQTGVIVLRNALPGEKKMRIAFGGRYAYATITEEWSVFTLTSQTQATKSDFALYTPDNTPFNVDIAYISIKSGENGALINNNGSVMTIKHEQTVAGFKVNANSTYSFELLPVGAITGDFPIVSTKALLGALEMMSPRIIASDKVRIVLRNDTASDITVASAEWYVKVFKHVYI